VSTCEELRAKATGVASLPEDDPEREEYVRHARTCPGCMAALQEGEKLHIALARAELPRPSRRALDRASTPILAELRPLPWRLRTVAALAAFAVPLLFSLHRDWEGWAAALVVLAAATALSMTAGILRAGAWVALAASAGFAIGAGGIPGFGDAGAGLAVRVGLDCFGLEILGGAIAAGLVLWRRDRVPGSLPAMAAAGALAAQASLHLVCAAHAEAPHLWVFHVGGVAAAAFAGWVVQSRLYASSVRS
jgi:hypothetical protein